MYASLPHNIRKSDLPAWICNFESIGEIAMLCTIIDIRGDYAFVKYDATGIISEVAIALLPLGVDIGDRLKFEDFEFTQV